MQITSRRPGDARRRPEATPAPRAVVVRQVADPEGGPDLARFRSEPASRVEQGQIRQRAHRPSGPNKICVHRRYTIRATIAAGPLIGRLMSLRLLSEQGARRKAAGRGGDGGQRRVARGQVTAPATAVPNGANVLRPSQLGRAARRCLGPSSSISPARLARSKSRWPSQTDVSSRSELVT